MRYFIVPILLAFYFEILGQYIYYKIKKEQTVIGFPIGMLCVLAITYITTSLLTSNNVYSGIVFGMYFIEILISIVLIIKDIKIIKFQFNRYHTVLVTFVIIFTLYSLNTTLGDLGGFDTTFYLNMVSSNADLIQLNSIEPLVGNGGLINRGYSFQTYYYFASFIVFLVKNIINVYPNILYIWTFQILYFLLLFSLIIYTYKKLVNKKIVIFVLMLLLFGFYFGKLYFNNVFGFYGNSFRTLCVGYVTYFLYDYFKDSKFENKILVSVAVFAGLSTSSSMIFIILIMFAGLFFINIKNDDNFIKWTSIIFILPLTNLLSIKQFNCSIQYSLIEILIICIIVFIVSNKLNKIIVKFKINWIMLTLCFVLLTIMSYRTTGRIFNIDAITNNLSETADMTIQYFSFTNTITNRTIYCVLFFIVFALSILLDFRNKYVQLGLVLIIAFYNPFCCGYINAICSVYYRSYEILINPFVYTVFISIIVDRINNRNIMNIIFGLLTMLLAMKTNFISPDYYHYSFIPDQDYDELYKMSKLEKQIIDKLLEDVSYNEYLKPRIVTNNLLTQSIIPNGEYFFGRSYEENIKWTDDEHQIYSIFYPSIYWGDEEQPKDADFENMGNYIKKANIDYIVLDKDIEYYDSNKNIWYSMIYKLNEYKYPFFENEKYAIYHFEKNSTN